MKRHEKHELVGTLKETFKGVSLIVAVHQEGVTVEESFSLRSKSRKAGATFKVVKNTLLRLAIQGTPHEPLSDLLSGPTGIAFSEDPIAAVKVLAKFMKECQKMTLLGGVLNGVFLDKEALERLAKLPSLDELRGTVVGLLAAPAQKIIRTISAPGAQIARVLNAYSQK